jgi:hypothetical protein
MRGPEHEKMRRRASIPFLVRDPSFRLEVIFNRNKSSDLAYSYDTGGIDPVTFAVRFCDGPVDWKLHAVRCPTKLNRKDRAGSYLPICPGNIVQRFALIASPKRARRDAHAPGGVGGERV